ncbi:Ger(x)C family spore germination protein [Bacillus weihaiensis]|uniref:Ger(x)C family spore germination protein n=1 Tax=Bacillus weihaiensis TaxID=1547283 RepID=UPI002353FEB5|nr:Ger(x)C family spore germination protein [Bacillus weihaiensis]
MKQVILSIFILLFSTGCASNQIIDDLAMIDTVTYDVSEDEEKPIAVTINFPTVSGEGTVHYDVLSTNAKSSKDSRMTLSNETNLEITSGQLNVAMFGEELARQGIDDILDTFMRDPTLGPRAFFCVTKDKAASFLFQKQKEGPDTSKYIRTYLEKRTLEKESLNFTAFQFLRDVSDDGVDPFLPYFIIEENHISQEGYALFKKDKFISSISPEMSAILFFLRKDVPKGTMSIEIKANEQNDQENIPFPVQLVFNYSKSSYDTILEMKKDQPISVELNIHLEGSVLEYTGDELLDEEDVQKKLEKDVETYFTTKSQEFFTLTQELGVDPLGIGARIRNQLTYDQWKQLNWDETYPTIKLKVTPKMEFMNTGQAK